MKKIAFILSLFMLTVLPVNAQLKEGYIKYDIEITSDNPDMETAITMMKGTTLELYFKENMTKSIMQMGAMMNMVTLTDAKSDKNLILMDGMVGRNAIESTLTEIKEEQSETPKFKVNLINETKVIEGYTCKKATLTDTSGSESIYWYTEEIEISKEGQNYLNDQIPGFPLEFEMNQGPMVLKMKASSLVKTAADSNFDFTIPQGYKTMTMEQLKKMGM